MNIVIKPIGKRIITDGVHIVGIEVYKGEEVEELQAKYKEAIEAFSELLTESLNNYDGMPNSQRRAAESYYSDEIGIIEKATGKSWKELQE